MFAEGVAAVQSEPEARLHPPPARKARASAPASGRLKPIVTVAPVPPGRERQSQASEPPAIPMNDPSTDRNLLFGVLAVQNAFVTRERLAAAMSAWALDKSRPLSRILVEQGALSDSEGTLLDDLVARHLARHHDDLQQSLTAIKPSGVADPLAPVREAVRLVADADVQATLEGTLCRSPGDASAPPANSTPASGRAPTAPRFCILRPHARGGLGQVFVAVDEELHREVALKEIQREHADDPESRARFLLEAEVTGRLEHPGIVPVYGLGTYVDGRPFYAMRFIKGDSLKEALARFHNAEGPGRDPGARQLELRQLLGRFVDVCNAVAYAHSRGVLHRDLKPANVMLGPYGETLVVDWGLAKVLGEAEVGGGHPEGNFAPATASGSASTQMGRSMGTPAYMSPEQAAGQLDRLGPASDVYSLGATLYSLLTGRAPWEDEEVDSVLRKLQRGDFPPPRQVNGQVPPALEAVCLKAMALKPQERYATPRLLAEDIERWLAEEPVSAYREPLSARLGRWVRRHRALVTSGVVVLATAAVALAVSTLLIGDALRSEEQARKERALAQVEALLTANPRAVPHLLEGLKGTRADVLPRLRALWEQERGPKGRGRRIRVGLALLALDGGEVNESPTDWILQADDPQEVLLLRDALRPRRAVLAPALWKAVDAAKAGSQRRFRALVALAEFDPGNARWRQSGKEVVKQFLSANSLYLDLWTEALRPVRGELLAPLGAVFRGEALPGKGQLAAEILAKYAADRPEVLARLVLDADPSQWAEVFPPLRLHADRATLVLHKELAKPMPPQGQTAAQDLLARRQAQAAVALAQLGQAEAAWPLLKHSPDPSRRTYLTLALGRLKSDVGPLLLRVEQGGKVEVSERRALILALGEFTAEQLPAARREKLVAMLLQWYREDPDAGIHSAIDWLLRHGKQGDAARKLDWGQGEALRQIDAELAGKEAGARRWYVTGKEGHTFAVLRAPGVFLMGSPLHEPDRSEIETPHSRKIPRSFAVATKAVTVGQFRRFLEATPAFKRLHNYTKKYAPQEACPQTAVTWYEAAAYCNWLSQQEGIPEEEWCYPKDPAEIKEGMVLAKGYLGKAGYRLPTEAEWEYACRAGAVTSRYYGTAKALLGEYAWYQKNSGERTRPVGQLRPNDLGLFDALGNVWQWCQDRYLFYPVAAGRRGNEDQEDTSYKVDERSSRVLRGGSFKGIAPDVRCANRLNNRPAYRNNNVGLRPARTYR